MSDVEFEENNNEFHIKSRRLLGEPETPAMIRALLKTGVVKNEKQAVVILLIFIIVIFSISWFVVQGAVNPKLEFQIKDKYGNEYEVEEFKELLESGFNPLDR